MPALPGSSAGSATTQIVNGRKMRSVSALLIPESVATRIVSIAAAASCTSTLVRSWRHAAGRRPRRRARR